MSNQDSPEVKASEKKPEAHHLPSPGESQSEGAEGTADEAADVERAAQAKPREDAERLESSIEAQPDPGLVPESTPGPTPAPKSESDLAQASSADGDDGGSESAIETSQEPNSEDLAVVSGDSEGLPTHEVAASTALAPHEDAAHDVDDADEASHNLPSKAVEGELVASRDEDSNGQGGWAEGPEDDQPMSFWEHLSELRSRLMKSVGALVVGVVIAWFFLEPVQHILQHPLRIAWSNAGMGEPPALQVLRIQEPFMVDLRIALTTSVFISGPVIFYQIWMFISPGLYRHEKRFAIPFVLTSFLMFILGTAFAYFVVVPYGFQWLLEYRPEMYSVQPKLEEYIRDITRILLAFGAVFEFPLLTAFLAKMGVVHHKMLLRHWRAAILIIFVIAAILTPPDPMTQLLMAAPMIVLFFASVVVAKALYPHAIPEPEPEPQEG